MRVEIYGASDDLIEMEGDFREELDCCGDDDGRVLAFSDGTALRVRYDDDGFWRITTIFRGSANLTKIEATDPDGDYSDRVTLEGDFAWMVHGPEVVKPHS
jgi:hypothetical protein